MKKVIIFPQYMNGAERKLEGLQFDDEFNVVFEAFNEVFEKQDDVVCEFYYYNVNPSDLEHFNRTNPYKIKELKSDRKDTIHKIVFSPNKNNEISFIDTGHSDILSAVLALSEDEIKQSFFIGNRISEVGSENDDIFWMSNGRYLSILDHLSTMTSDVVKHSYSAGDYLCMSWCFMDIFGELKERLSLEESKSSSSNDKPNNDTHQKSQQEEPIEHHPSTVR